MHSIEPYFQWRDLYTAETDEKSPFFGREYDEFEFQNSIYNYYIHPQWDYFGSPTLYLKLLYANYDRQFAIIELIGEWNDTLHNDIMFLKRHFADHLMEEGIYKFILICDNVLNFHFADNLYLSEWCDDLAEENGWISCINLLEHVYADFVDGDMQSYLHFDEEINDLEWRKMKPEKVYDQLEYHINKSPKKLSY
jgi:hypothetical protein